MENLNAENVKKELEGLANFRTCPEYIKDALALITSQEQRIFDLEKRLKECENGYEVTLAFERAKVKELTVDNAWCAKRILEADKKIKELTEERNKASEKGAEILTRLEEAYLKLESENLKLAEENANLHASCTEFERKCASLNEENERLKVDNEILKMPRATIFEIADAYNRGRKKGEADTVREFAERLKAEMSFGRYIQADQIDQIAKEMLEGENNGV